MGGKATARAHDGGAARSGDGAAVFGFGEHGKGEEGGVNEEGMDGRAPCRS